MNDPAAARAAEQLSALLVEIDNPPKKQPKRQRSNVERFRTDDEEHAALHGLAQDSGLSFGAFMRASTIGKAGARSRRQPPSEHSRLRFQHVTAINRAGNLVNQGIRELHRIERAAPAADHRDRLAYELEAVRKLLQSAIPALNAALAAVVSDDSQG